MNGRLLFLATLLLTSLLASVSGDTVFLNNGGRVEGRLLNPHETPRVTYQVDTEAGRVALSSDQVDRVVIKSDAERSYDSFVVDLPDTPEAHWDTAERCEKAGLLEQREFHLEQVLRLDPNHEKARHALGYSRVDGNWVRPDEVMRGRGYVRHRNAWRLPQEVELDAMAEVQEKQTVEWRKKLKMWRDWIVKNRDRAAEGRNEILRIRDPLAAEALVESLTKDKEPPIMRLLYVEPLAAMGGPEALRAFVRIVLEDRDPQVREACLDKLAKSGSKPAVRQFIKALKHDDNVIVHRAAAALARMNDSEATPALIEALITEHKKMVGSSGITPTFTGDGGGGLSMGGGPKVVKIKVQNEPVLHALLSMHPGTAFGYDQKRWRAWFVDQNAPRVQVNLRRGQ